MWVEKEWGISRVFGWKGFVLKEKLKLLKGKLKKMELGGVGKCGH